MHQCRIALALAGALLSAGAASATALQATPATFWTVLAKTSQPGDTILLAPGEYIDPKLFRVTKAAPGVVVKPVKGAAVRLSAITLNTSEGITFDSVTVAGSVKFSNSARVGIVNATLRPSQGAGCVLVRNSAEVLIARNDMTGCGVGVSLYDNRVGGIVVDQNHIHDINGPDAIDSFSSSNVTISRNDIHDIAPAAGAHPDAIQIDSPVPGGVRSNNVRIEANTYRIGTGPGSVGAQGVFVGHADNVTARGNRLFGTMFNGVSLSDVTTGEISDNITTSGIVVRGASDSVKVTGNVAQAISDYAPNGAPANTNLTFRDNRVRKGGVTEGDFTTWDGRGGGVATPAQPLRSKPRSKP